MQVYVIIKNENMHKVHALVFYLRLNNKIELEFSMLTLNVVQTNIEFQTCYENIYSSPAEDDY